MNVFLRLFRTRPFSLRVPGLQQRVQGPTAWFPAARLSPYPRPKWNPLLSHLAMSTSSFQFEYMEDVERLEYYRSGGYHPISINDRLHDRYRIVHKLGHGGFSTVWLALDEASSNYVAIKVCIADADSGEINILSWLTQKEKNDEAQACSLVPRILDRFTIDGPNGTHSCLVTLPARCSLKEAKEASDTALFKLDVARSIAARLTMAVSYVHSQGYAHGDLHLRNIFLQLPSSLNSLTIPELYKRFDAPDPQPVRLLRPKQSSSREPQPHSLSLPAGVPSHAIVPVWLGKPSEEVTLDEANIILSDFGVAFRPSENSRFQSYTPLVYRPPEAFFDPTVPLSFASDIWSLGCAIFELLGHRSLIDFILASQDSVLIEQVHLQGPPPAGWWARWEKRGKWFEDDGTPRDESDNVWGWDKKFEEWVQELRRYYRIDPVGSEEKEAFLDMLKWKLAWRPEERPRAKQVLETRWMREWAIPAYQRGRKVET